MAYDALINIYVRHIKNGLRTLQRVPKVINGFELRKAVENKLEEVNRESSEEESKVLGVDER